MMRSKKKTEFKELKRIEKTSSLLRLKRLLCSCCAPRWAFAAPSTETHLRGPGLAMCTEALGICFEGPRSLDVPLAEFFDSEEHRGFTYNLLVLYNDIYTYYMLMYTVY